MGGLDIRVPLDPILTAFGERGQYTILPPNEPPTVATVILGTLNPEFPPGAELGITEVRKVAAVRRADAPSLPTGTRLELIGDPLKVFVVESVIVDDGEMVRALIKEAPTNA
ncbi:MAG TPA: hypothetical protein VLZ09_01160 [Gaiellaceae bacterium]|nr:hypothetical protein [Gaiellaceae bacterium]